MNLKKLYLFYFCYGVLNSVAIQMLPVFLDAKGFGIDQITTLLSLVFLAALFQPIIGYLTSHFITSIKMLKLLLILLVFCALLMYFVSTYFIMMFLILLFSMARLSISPIYDSYTTIICATNGGNFGFVRSGASLGFGTGMFIYAIIAAVFGADVNFSMLFIVIIAFFAIMTMAKFTAIENQESNHNVQEKSEGNKWGLFILLVLIYMMYFGGLSTRITYLSTYYLEFDYTLFFVALTTFIMVIPEITIMPLYNRLFSRFNKELLIGIAILLGVIQLQGYIHFYDNPYILIFTSLFNGLQIMIFFPTFFALLQQTLAPKYAANGFLINMTLQSLFVGLFNQFVIKPAYIQSGTTITIMVALTYLLLASVIPLAIYHIKMRSKRA